MPPVKRLQTALRSSQTPAREPGGGAAAAQQQPGSGQAAAAVGNVAATLPQPAAAASPASAGAAAAAAPASQRHFAFGTPRRQQQAHQLQANAGSPASIKPAADPGSGGHPAAHVAPAAQPSQRRSQPAAAAAAAPAGNSAASAAKQQGVPTAASEAPTAGGPDVPAEAQPAGAVPVPAPGNAPAADAPPEHCAAPPGSAPPTPPLPQQQSPPLLPASNAFAATAQGPSIPAWPPKTPQPAQATPVSAYPPKAGAQRPAIQLELPWVPAAPAAAAARPASAGASTPPGSTAAAASRPATPSSWPPPQPPAAAPAARVYRGFTEAGASAGAWSAAVPDRIVEVITPAPQPDPCSDMDVSAEEGEVLAGGGQSALHFSLEWICRCDCAVLRRGFWRAFRGFYTSWRCTKRPRSCGQSTVMATLSLTLLQGGRASRAASCCRTRWRAWSTSSSRSTSQRAAPASQRASVSFQELVALLLGRFTSCHANIQAECLLLRRKHASPRFCSCSLQCLLSVQHSVARHGQCLHIALSHV